MVRPLWKVLAFLAGLLLPELALGEGVDLRFEPLELPCADPSARVIVELAGGGPLLERDLALPATDPALLQLPALPQGATLRLRSERCWAPPFSVGQAPPQAIRLPLYPLAGVSFSVPPGSFRQLRFTLSRGFSWSKEAFRFEAECAVEISEVRCRVPRTGIHVRIERSEGAPTYLWELSWRDDFERRLGYLPLQKGGSIAGWIQVPRSGIPRGAQVVAALRPQGPPEHPETGMGRPAPRPPVRDWAATLHPIGIFQLAGLAPGIYDIAVRAPGGFLGSRREVSVPGDREVILESPLELRATSLLRVLVTPPEVAEGVAWTVELHGVVRDPNNPAIPFLEPLRTTTADASGEARFAELEAGEYAVVLRRGERAVVEQIVEIPADGGSFEELLELQVEWLRLEGSLRCNGKPLPGEVKIRSSRNRAPFEQEVPLDQEGRFEAEFARPDWIRLGFQAVDPPRWRVEGLASLRIERARHQPYRLEVDLEGGALEGRVVGEDGQPVAHASVDLQRDALIDPTAAMPTAARAETDPQGRFSFPCVPQGSWQLWARDPDPARPRASERLRIQVGSGSELEGLTLVVRELERVEFELRREGTPVTSGGALCAPSSWPPERPVEGPVMTSPWGNLWMFLPRGKISCLFFDSVGALLRSFNLQGRADSDPIRVELPGWGATLLLRESTDEGEGGRQESGSWAPRWIASQGAALRLWDLGYAGRVDDPRPGSTRVEGLEPGSYLVCGPVSGCAPLELAAGSSREVATLEKISR